MFTSDGVVHCKQNDKDNFIYKHTPNSNNFIAIENNEDHDSDHEDSKSCILNLELVSRKGNKKLKAIECHFLHHYKTELMKERNFFILKINGCIVFVQQSKVKTEENKKEDDAILTKNTPVKVMTPISGDDIGFHEFGTLLEFLGIDGDQLEYYQGISLKFETIIDAVYDSPCLTIVYRDSKRCKLLFMNMLDEWKTKRDH
jgi:hypothetical protein